MEKHLLSKSTFIRANQCLKSLYLYKNYYHLRDKISPEQQAIFSRGTNVGILAQQLFPGGIDVTPENQFKYQESVIRTKQLIDEGVEVIYEAAFQYNQALVALDILVKKDNKWIAYEVKSSSRISYTYLLDASLQYFVITNSGLPLSDIFILHINNDYVRMESLEINKLFQFVSVKEEALKNQSMVKQKITETMAMIGSGNMPEIEIGEHCSSPYNCDFSGTCWKVVPQNSVFELVGVSKTDQFEMYRKGIKTIKDVPDNYSLNKDAKVQVTAFKENKTLIDKEAIAKFINTLHYPLYFMDFETFMPAVPIYNYSKPYQHIPFQYSLHYIEKKGGEVKHFEFLAETGTDPRRIFIERLLKDTERAGDVLVYDATFEKSILKSLKYDFPEYAKSIDELVVRIKDLMIPFKEKIYYHPAMKGSYSIKNVLPALVPELNYSNLKIGSGGIAMAAFENLQKETDIFKIAETRDSLIEYCKLDTFAMVKILEVLENSVDE